MSGDRSGLYRREIAPLLHPGEQSAALVDVRLPAQQTSADRAGSYQDRLVRAIGGHKGFWDSAYCLVTTERVIFVAGRRSRGFEVLLELRPQEITAAAARPGARAGVTRDWHVVIEFCDASVVALLVWGFSSGKLAGRLASLLAQAGTREPRAEGSVRTWSARTVKVSGVRAEPGGPVTVTFSGDGLSVCPERLGARIVRRVGWLASGWGALLYAGVAVAAGAAATALASHHAPVPVQNAALVVFFVALACMVLLLVIRGAAEAAGYLLLALAILALPSLLIPRFRHWLGRNLRSARAPAEPGNRVPAANMAGVQIERYGRAMAVWVGYASGQQVRYLARGRNGRQLAREWERLCPPVPGTEAASMPDRIRP